jgi:sugar O-acyltransferase (sialic acid O-acetyltransferase NeuD family)
MTTLYIWGAGGHGRVVFDCAIAAGYHAEFLDDNPRRHGPNVRPSDHGLALASAGDTPVHIAIGDNRVRAACFRTATACGLRTATLVHPAAIVSPSAAIGEGTLVMPGAFVNAGARVGRNVIVNTGAIVEHDCVVGDHVHLAPRSVLGGGVTVKSYTLFGIGAVALPGITVGEGVVVGAGAVVIADIENGLTVAGVPAVAISRAISAGSAR